MDHIIVVLAESSIEDIQVGYLFLSKKGLRKKLSVFSIRKTFQYRVDRSNKKLYVLRYVDSGCLSKLRAIKMRDSNMLKFLSTLVLTHTKRCYRNKITRKLIFGSIQSKYQDVSRGYRSREIIQNFLKEYRVDIT